MYGVRRQVGYVFYVCVVRRTHIHTSRRQMARHIDGHFCLVPDPAAPCGESDFVSGLLALPASSRYEERTA
jgi:hypothetical protein